MTDEEEKKTVKLVIQQCLSARLKPPPPPEGGGEEGDVPFGPERRIGAGMVVFVCFAGGATEAAAARAAEAVARLRLCEPAEPDAAGREGRQRRVSVLERRGDVLAVPQATLGAKLKGRNSLQYHGNVDKADGERLFAAFCAALEAQLGVAAAPEVAAAQGAGRVVAGVYGARQRLAMDTDGPYTHTLQL